MPRTSSTSAASFEALGADAIELSGYNWLGLGKKKVPTFYLDRAKAIRPGSEDSPHPGGRRPGPRERPGHPGRGHRLCLRLPPLQPCPAGDFVQHLEKGEDSACIGCTKCLGNIWAKEGRRCVKHPIPPEFASPGLIPAPTRLPPRTGGLFLRSSFCPQEI